jgi:hypothetical protein
MARVRIQVMYLSESLLFMRENASLFLTGTEIKLINFLSLYSKSMALFHGTPQSHKQKHCPNHRDSCNQPCILLGK